MVEGRYSDIDLAPPPQEEKREDRITIEAEIIDVRGKGFSSPSQEEQLRAQGLVVCFIKRSASRPCTVFVNGVEFELPIGVHIRVPVSVADVLANAGCL